MNVLIFRHSWFKEVKFNPDFAEMKTGIPAGNKICVGSYKNYYRIVPAKAKLVIFAGRFQRPSAATDRLTDEDHKAY